MGLNEQPAELLKARPNLAHIRKYLVLETDLTAQIINLLEPPVDGQVKKNGDQQDSPLRKREE